MLSFIAAIAPVAAAGNTSISTEVVTAYTTYCPEPTTFVEGTSTYIVTAPTTLTISDCPCTRTHTYSTATVTVCPTSSGAPSPASANGTSSAILPNAANNHGVSYAAAVGAFIAVAGLL